MSTDIALAELLARIAARYAAITTYRDTGDLTTVMITGPSSWQRMTKRLKLRTEFARPASFRFEMQEVGVGPESEWSRSVAWQVDSASQSSTWDTLRAEVTGPVTLRESLGALAGVSGATSWPVARLVGLVSKDFGPFPDEGSWRIEGQRELDGRTCTVVQSLDSDSHDRFWFEEDTCLLRRMDSRHEFDQAWNAQHVERLRAQLAQMGPDDEHRVLFERVLRQHLERTHVDFTSESVATWYPEVDPKLDMETFHFIPPTR